MRPLWPRGQGEEPHQVVRDAHSSGALSEDGHVLRVAAERPDVLPDPFQNWEHQDEF